MNAYLAIGSGGYVYAIISRALFETWLNTNVPDKLRWDRLKDIHFVVVTINSSHFYFCDDIGLINRIVSDIDAIE